MLVSAYLVVYVEIRYHGVLITFLFEKLILRQNRGNHTSTVSDTPIQTKRYAKPLRCVVPWLVNVVVSELINIHSAGRCWVSGGKFKCGFAL